jgi:hypothetical protein
MESNEAEDPMESKEAEEPNESDTDEGPAVPCPEGTVTDAPPRIFQALSAAQVPTIQAFLDSRSARRGVMLFGFVVVDSSSRRFDEYFRAGILEIDRAGGPHVEFGTIGSSAESGPVHKSLCSPELREQEERDARAWGKIRASGGEDFYRSEQVMAAADQCGLRPEDVPCIAWFNRTDTRPFAILRISLSWFDSDASWRVFNRSFREWLQRDDVTLLAAQDLDESTLKGRFGPLLEGLTVEVNKRLQARADEMRSRWIPWITEAARNVLGAWMAPRGRKSRGRVREPFPTPAGTRWSDVIVRVGDLQVTVEVGRMRREFTFEAAGFEDERRNGVPDGIWTVLRVFAMQLGRIPYQYADLDHKTRQKLRQKVSDLRRRLQALIPGIDSDPIPHDKRRCCYQMVCAITSRSTFVFPVPSGTPWRKVAVSLTRTDAVRIAVPGTVRFPILAYINEPRGALRREEMAERQVEEVYEVSLRVLGLVDGEGRLDPRGRALVEILRGNGVRKRTADDDSMTDLGGFLKEAMDADEFPFEVTPDKMTWVARFQASCEAPPV